MAPPPKGAPRKQHPLQVQDLPGEPQANNDSPKKKTNKQYFYPTSYLQRRQLKRKYKINQSEEQEGTHVTIKANSCGD